MFLTRFVFAHDERFSKAVDGFYSSGSFPALVWRRYLKVCDELTVVGRDGGFAAGDLDTLAYSSSDFVKFQLLPNISNLRSLVFGNSEASRLCKKIVSDHDAVIARLPSRIGELFVREAIFQNKPYALEVVGDPKESLQLYGSWKGRAYSSVAAKSMRRFVKNSPFTIYVTKDYLQGLYPCKGGTTSFCSDVSIDSVDEYILNKRIKRCYGNTETYVFGLIGNFSAQYKGIDVAIRALSSIKDQLLCWELQVVGRGDSSYYSSLAESLGVGDRVRFVGSLPSGQSVFKWLDDVDIYLQPSLTEGLPRALVEAMSRGCPAIASSVGGIPELLLGNQMVPPGDYKGLARKILDLVNDTNAQHDLAVGNFEKAKEYYSDVIEERRSHFWRAFRKYVDESRF